ncbi:putative quinol monooxygenase [Paenibacillus sp. SI8]|uniref:putative quinol monooxygenase n=1 Tax=unclassified Paenibacillus TaxID=185978 RepID=UPI003466EE3D
MNKFAMYGKLTAHPGQRDALVQILLEAAELLKSMEGCELYIVNLAEDDLVSIWVTELWRDAEAHAGSLRDEKVWALIQRGRSFIAGVEQVKLRPIGGKGF